MRKKVCSARHTVDALEDFHLAGSRLAGGGAEIAPLERAVAAARERALTFCDGFFIAK